jgi:tRNA(Ile2) C34 agmatinyltransferase TiaS
LAVERICPNCRKPAYSAADLSDWQCPRCGADIPKRKEGETLRPIGDPNYRVSEDNLINLAEWAKKKCRPLMGQA